MVLPDSVTTLLKSTRFVHLATSVNDIPHVTLMNYTYYHDNDGPTDVIIMSTPRNTTKFTNLQTNPNVSLLVHDWISAKESAPSSSSNDQPPRRNSLYEMLANINKNEISRVSVMILGKAQVMSPDDPKFSLYKSLHLNNNKIDLLQAKNYIEDDVENALVVIAIDQVKVTDTEGNIEVYE